MMAQMSSDVNIASVIYVILALFLIGGSGIAIFKKDMSKAIQMILIWALLFAGLTLAYGLFK